MTTTTKQELWDLAEEARNNLAGKATLRKHASKARDCGFVTAGQLAEISRVAGAMGVEDGWCELLSYLR